MTQPPSPGPQPPATQPPSTGLQPPGAQASPLGPRTAARASDGPLRSIGKGVVQANLRLALVLEALDSGGSRGGSPAGPDVSGPLFDLIDALDSALAHGKSRPQRRRLFGLLAPLPSAPDPIAEGLRVALRQAVEQLARVGLRPVPVEGALDPRLHRVVGRLPSPDPAQIGEIAAVQSRGWRRSEGESERILRPACVTVWSAPSELPVP